MIIGAYKAIIRTAKADLDNHYVYGWDVESADEQGNISTDAYQLTQNMHYSAFDNNFSVNFNTLGLEHTILMGFDFIDAEFDDTRLSGPAPSININAPIYGRTVAAPKSINRNETESQRQLGFYIQDQISIHNWRLNAGLRHDKVEIELENHLSNSKKTEDDSATTGRIGANYLFTKQLSSYASFAQSFLPQSGNDAQGNHFKPTEGEQLELGLKYQSQEDKQLITLALFDLTKSNVTTRDLENPSEKTQTGEINSSGFEIEAKQQLGDSFNIISQFSYTDVEIYAK